LNDVCSFKTG